MKKLPLVLLSLAISMTSFKVLAETYICTQDLTKHGSPGEIETRTFERSGNSLGAYYISNLFDVLYEITYESKSNLILSRL